MKKIYAIYDVRYKTFFNGLYKENDDCMYVDFTPDEFIQFKSKKLAEARLKKEKIEHRSCFDLESRLGGRVMVILEIYK